MDSPPPPYPSKTSSIVKSGSAVTHTHTHTHTLTPPLTTHNTYRNNNTVNHLPFTNLITSTFLTSQLYTVPSYLASEE